MHRLTYISFLLKIQTKKLGDHHRPQSKG